jgi:hypothetical protein
MLMKRIGYFSLNHFQMGPAQDILGQLWKEYAFSDSRYLTSDPFVLCMETVTAVRLPFPFTPSQANIIAGQKFTWGPICLLLPFLIVKSHPLRHPLQIIVCVGQIYGLILYYATSMFDHYYTGVTYSRPEFLYFWFYYFFMNFIWMVFPGSKCNSFLLPFRGGVRKLCVCEQLSSLGAASANVPFPQRLHLFLKLDLSLQFKFFTRQLPWSFCQRVLLTAAQTVLLVSSVRTIAKAFNALDELNASKNQNGMVNGKKHN